MPSLFDTQRFNGSLFFPREDDTPPPAGAEELFLPVEAGTLHVRWHRSPQAEVTLLLFHGNGEVASDYDDLAPIFARCGADLAVMDYRGYGRSRGEATYRTMLTDARIAADAVAERSGLPLVLMGRSLGCACLAELYAEPPAAAVGAVWESGYVDLGGLVARRGMAVPEAFPEVDLVDFDPLRRLRLGSLPFLALHGAEDTIIAPEESEAACTAAGSARKTLVRIPGRGHNDIGLDPRYWEALATFFASL